MSWRSKLILFLGWMGVWAQQASAIDLSGFDPRSSNWDASTGVLTLDSVSQRLNQVLDQKIQNLYFSPTPSEARTHYLMRSVLVQNGIEMGMSSEFVRRADMNELYSLLVGRLASRSLTLNLNYQYVDHGLRPLRDHLFSNESELGFEPEQIRFEILPQTFGEWKIQFEQKLVPHHLLSQRLRVILHDLREAHPNLYWDQVLSGENSELQRLFENLGPEYFSQSVAQFFLLQIQTDETGLNHVLSQIQASEESFWNSERSQTSSTSESFQRLERYRSQTFEELRRNWGTGDSSISTAEVQIPVLEGELSVLANPFFQLSRALPHVIIRSQSQVRVVILKRIERTTNEVRSYEEPRVLRVLQYSLQKRVSEQALVETLESLLNVPHCDLGRCMSPHLIEAQMIKLFPNLPQFREQYEPLDTTVLNRILMRIN